MSTVKTGQVTYAVRNTSIDGKEINKDDIMGIGDAGVLAVGTDINETTMATIDEMMDDDAELISIYYGEDIKAEQADALQAALSEKYPLKDIVVQEGSQPVYYYIMSVE